MTETEIIQETEEQLSNILEEPPDAWQWHLHTPAFVLPAFALTRAPAAWMQNCCFIFKCRITQIEN